MRFVITIVGVVLIAVDVVREQLAGVQEVAVDFESLVRGVHCVEVDWEVWIGLGFASGEDVEGFGGEEG